MREKKIRIWIALINNGIVLLLVSRCNSVTFTFYRIRFKHNTQCSNFRWGHVKNILCRIHATPLERLKVRWLTRHSFKCKTDSITTISNNQITAGKTNSSHSRLTRLRIIVANNIIFTYCAGSLYHFTLPDLILRSVRSHSKHLCPFLDHYTYNISLTLFYLVVASRSSAPPLNLNALDPLIDRLTDDVLNDVAPVLRRSKISMRILVWHVFDYTHKSHVQ